MHIDLSVQEYCLDYQTRSMINEKDISHALAQCRCNPWEIGYTLYRFYIDQPLQLMKQVFKRLHQKQQLQAIGQLKNIKFRLQRDGNGHWHNVEQCITYCRQVQEQSSNQRTCVMCTEFFNWNNWKNFFNITGDLPFQSSEPQDKHEPPSI